MGATTMPSMSWLIKRLKIDFPDITFQQVPSGPDSFAWLPSTLTVSYSPRAPHAVAFLFHELSHGVLEHHAYSRDVELLSMEMSAWAKARQLAEQYELTISEAVVQDALDTYREWLHARSTCPTCTATGYQIEASTYECPACLERWHVNEARSCALRRYRQPAHTEHPTA